MDPNPERVVADNVESLAPSPTQGTAPTESWPATSNQDKGAKQAFFSIMNDWFNQYIQTNLAVQQPPNPDNPPVVPVVPLIINPERLNKPLVDKIRKYGAEEFRATVDDDPGRAEFWLENTIWVFDELSCTPVECVKCTVSLLKDTAYQWWNTLISVVPRERVTWEFF